ncbi:MAG: transcriptional repressor LexA [Ruminococcaceae bacterium]|nr:transcriptional repressor LexA [Oscillospiraceae bacterium]
MSKRAEMQQRIYQFILESIRENGYAPSVREIGDAVGLKSPSTVHFHLKNLAELGYIEKGAFKGRAIVPTDRGAAAQAKPRAEEPPRPRREAAPEPVPKRVPIVGSVAAGSPILAQECIEDYLTFDTGGRDGEYFALRVRGESMLGVGILPGDLVVVHQQQTARNGEIVVALLEDEATVKTFDRRDGHIWLLPANPEYQPIDGTGCTIMGKVVAVVRQY